MNIKYYIYVLPFRFLDFLLYTLYTIIISELGSPILLGIFYFYLALLGIIMPLYLKRFKLRTEFLLKISSILIIFSIILLYSSNIILIFLSALFWIFSAYYHFLSFYSEEDDEEKYALYEMLTRIGWLIAGIVGYFTVKYFDINLLFDIILIVSIFYLFVVLLYKKEGIIIYLEEIGNEIEISLSKLRLHLHKPHLTHVPIKIIRDRFIIDFRGFLATFGSAIFFTGLNYFVVRNFGGDTLFLCNTLSLLVNACIFKILENENRLKKIYYSIAALSRSILFPIVLIFIFSGSIYAYLFVGILAGLTWPIFLLYDNILIIRKYGKSELGSLTAFRNLGTLSGSLISGIIFAIFPLSIGIFSFVSYAILSILALKSR